MNILNNPDLFNIQGKVVLITGAFGLFGKKLCDAFLNQGARVIAAGHNTNKVDSISSEFAVKYDSNNFLVTSLELTSTISIEECISNAINRFGRIDILINNASIDAKFDANNLDEVKELRFENYPIDKIKNSVEVNLIGTIEITQKVCAVMLKQNEGNIINVGSIYSIVSPNQNLYKFKDKRLYKPVDYVASKSFIPNFTRYLASFYAENNIRCNAIAPHGIYNEHDESFIENFKKYSPIGRMCDIDEIEGAFIFLASEASSYMTGSTLVLDGGWSSI